MILAGNQPCYLPSPRLFHRIAHADVFMHCPHLQYTRKSFQSHNFIRGNTGTIELCVPCKVPSTAERKHVSIAEVTIDGTHWARKHLKSIAHNYAKERFFSHYFSELEKILGHPWEHLAALNQTLIEKICEWLQFKVSFVNSADWKEWSGDRIDKEIQMCKRVGASAYLQSENAKYLYPEIERFKDAGISLPTQQYPPQLKELSVIDWIMRFGGPEAGEKVRNSGVIIS